MTRISSKATFFQKRVFPVLLFGFLAFVLVSVAEAAAAHGVPVIVGIAVVLVVLVYVFFLTKRLMFDLADEVWDAGDSLVVRRGAVEVRIPFAQIRNVSYTVMTNPNRVTLNLREAGLLGDEVSFIAPTTWVPFRKSPVILDLIDRIDRPSLR